MDNDMKVNRHGTKTRMLDLNHGRVTAPVAENVSIINPTDTSHNVTKPIMEFKEIIPTKENESPASNEMAN